MPREHADESAPSQLPLTGPQPSERRVTAAPTPSAQADRIVAAAAPTLAVQPSLDFGDTEVGRVAHREMFAFNTAKQDDAVVSVVIDGEPTFQLESARTTTLWPNQHDASKGIKVLFAPQRAGRFQGSVSVKASWQGGEHQPETHTIAVAGAAHQPGDPTTTEVEARQKRAEQERAKQDADQKDSDRVTKENEEFLETDFDLPKGTEVRLQQEKEQLLSALQELTGKQAAGVDNVIEQIRSYTKPLPAPDKSVAVELAYAALQAAGTLLGARVAGAIGSLMEFTLTRTEIHRPAKDGPNDKPEGPIYVREISPPKVFIDTTSKLVSEMFKKVIRAHVKPDETSVENAPAPGTLDDGARWFLVSQLSALHERRHEQAKHVITTLHTLFLRQLVASPQTADATIGMMAAVRTSIEKQNEIAAAEQTQATATAWVRYLAHSSTETITTAEAKAKKRVTGGEQRIVDVDDMNQRVDDHQPLAERPGILEISFDADYNEPGGPISITRARIVGISQALAKHFSGRTIGELGLPLRVVGRLGSDVATVTIVRDEAGNLAYTDNTSDSRPAWLSRVAGTHTGSKSDQMRGARKLLDEQVLTQRVGVETDSAT